MTAEGAETAEAAKAFCWRSRPKDLAVSGGASWLCVAWSFLSRNAFLATELTKVGPSFVLIAATRFLVTKGLRFVTTAGAASGDYSGYGFPGGDKSPLSFVLFLSGFRGNKSEQKSGGIAGLADASARKYGAGARWRRKSVHWSVGLSKSRGK
jgi:hypothetical protein